MTAATLDLAALLQQAVVHHQAGRLQEAERLYRAILHEAPAYADAHHNLGLLAVHTSQPAAGLPHLQAALTANPGAHQYWLSYIDALIQAGQADVARRVLALARQSGVHGNAMEALASRLGADEATSEPDRSSVLEQLFNDGDYAAMESAAQKMTLDFPGYAIGWKALGTACVLQGRGVDALAPLRRAAELMPEDVETHSNLGNVLEEQAQYAQAEASYRRALQIKPDYAVAHYNLGKLLQSDKRWAEAEASYGRALALKPDYAQAHNNLGAIFKEYGRLTDAEACYRRVLQLKPNDAEVHYNLGNVLEQQNRFPEARDSYRHSLQLKPDAARVHQSLSTISAYMSDYTDVVPESDTALALKSDVPTMWERRLYAFSYHPDLTAEQIFAQFVRWGDRFPDPATDFSSHDRTPARRLKVGYVSPDLRNHTSRFYFWPLFSNHDPAQVELYAYSNVEQEDGFTDQFKTLFPHWRNIRNLDTTQAAQLIRDDGIDILVDCCNHMRDDRLDVFTLKPAPIQVTWLGAAWTTGLKAVDYVLFDPYLAPEGTLAREKIVRLPHFFVAYAPREHTADIAPPPCLKNGYVTFGYSGRTERLNHRTFTVWGELLRRLPTARLILDYRPFEEPGTHAYYRQFLAQHGVDISRVIMRRSANIFEGLNDFDILLDCFPHSGGTMLFDALWMGVPALTLAGRPPLGRIGTSLMTNLGLPEWVAKDEEDYIGKACAFAAQPQVLTQLRTGMRERMRQSPVMDGPGFARGVEAAYRDMWIKWSEEKQ